jgi:ParB family chromosome partitioning protein
VKELLEIAVNEIDYSKTMLREIDGQAINDLKESIREHGILQPILVSKNDETGRFQVICGNHRLCAARGVGLKTISVIVVKLERPDDALIIAINENIQRLEMNPVKEGEVYETLMQTYSIDVLSKKIGKSRFYIEGRLKIWKNLHGDLKNQIGKTLTIGNAVALAKLPQTMQIEVYNKILENVNTKSPTSPMFHGGGGGNVPSPYCTCYKCGAKHLKGVSVEE